MAKFNPLNRGGNVEANGNAGSASGFGNWLGKLGQAALGTGKFKLQAMMYNQRYQQRQELFEKQNQEWDRRRAASNEDYQTRLEKAQGLMKDDPRLTAVTPEGGLARSAPVVDRSSPTKRGAPRQRKSKSQSKPRVAQGPTRDIIALRKAHEVGDGKVMSHRQAMGHRGYRTAFQAHIKAGGTEQNFLDNYTPLGYKSRRQNPGDNRNNNFNGGGNN